MTWAKGFVWYLDADDHGRTSTSLAETKTCASFNVDLSADGVWTQCDTRVRPAGLEGALRSGCEGASAEEKAAGAAPGPPRTAGTMLLRQKRQEPPRTRNSQVTHGTRGAAKRAASEKPKPRKRAKAEAAFGNEQAPLLGLDVYQKGEADSWRLRQPDLYCERLALRNNDDEDPFALPLLRRDHGATKVKMVLQRPMAKPGWKLPPEKTALRTLGPYIDAMRKDLEENTSPDTSKPLEFAASVDTSMTTWLPN